MKASVKKIAKNILFVVVLYCLYNYITTDNIEYGLFALIFQILGDFLPFGETIEQKEKV